MSEEISASMNAAAVNVPAVDTISAAQPASATRTASWLRGSGIVLAGSALVAVCAHLALPLYFTPVPLSLAPFAVLVLGLLLRPSLAAATLGAYLLEGAAGLPAGKPLRRRRRHRRARRCATWRLLPRRHGGRL